MNVFGKHHNMLLQQAFAKKGIIKTIEEIKNQRKEAFAKIREEMKQIGYTNIPETDEGLYFYLKRIGL